MKEKHLTVEDNTIILTTGLFDTGHVEDIYIEFKELIDSKKLKKPYSLIIDFTKSIEQYSLFLPEDKVFLDRIVRLLDESGRDISVWIMKKDSIYDHIFTDIRKSHKIGVKDLYYAESIEDAKALTKDVRNKKDSNL